MISALIFAASLFREFYKMMFVQLHPAITFDVPALSLWVAMVLTAWRWRARLHILIMEGES